MFHCCDNELSYAYFEIMEWGGGWGMSLLCASLKWGGDYFLVPSDGEVWVVSLDFLKSIMTFFYHFHPEYHHLYAISHTICVVLKYFLYYQVHIHASCDGGVTKFRAFQKRDWGVDINDCVFLWGC